MENSSLLTHQNDLKKSRVVHYCSHVQVYIKMYHTVIAVTDVQCYELDPPPKFFEEQGN